MQTQIDTPGRCEFAVRLEYVRLLVSKFDDCFRFYRDVMRLEVTWGEEGYSYADFKTGNGATLSIYWRKGMSKVLGTTNLPVDAVSQDRVALIFGVDDLDSTVAALRERGARFLTEPQDHPDWGIRTAHLRDADGNLIEVYSPMPRESWADELRELDEKYKKSK